jgi:hypothetical protein
MNMETDIQRADKGLRFLVVLAFVGAIAVGAAGLVAFEGWLDEVRRLAPADAGRALRTAFAWISGSAIVLSLLLGLSLLRLGLRIQRAAQFPLPGTRVIRDTTILRGDVARRRGKVFLGFGVVLMLCALGLCAASWLLYSTVFMRAI